MARIVEVRPESGAGPPNTGFGTVDMTPTHRGSDRSRADGKMAPGPSPVLPL